MVSQSRAVASSRRVCALASLCGARHGAPHRGPCPGGAADVFCLLRDRHGLRSTPRESSASQSALTNDAPDVLRWMRSWSTIRASACSTSSMPTARAALASASGDEQPLTAKDRRIHRYSARSGSSSCDPRCGPQRSSGKPSDGSADLRRSCRFMPPFSVPQGLVHGWERRDDMMPT